MVSVPLPTHLEELLAECWKLRTRATAAIEQSVMLRDQTRNLRDALKEELWHDMQLRHLKRRGDDRSY